MVGVEVVGDGNAWAQGVEIAQAWIGPAVFVIHACGHKQGDTCSDF